MTENPTILVFDSMGIPTIHYKPQTLEKHNFMPGGLYLDTAVRIQWLQPEIEANVTVKSVEK